MNSLTYYFTLLKKSIFILCEFFFFFGKTIQGPKLKNNDLGPDALCFKGLGLAHRN